jgi:glycosyltransferase involved in cell wall biosynthesis
MTPRILLGSFEVPGLGGSSTASFQLFKRMLADGRDVHYFNLIDEDPAFLQCTFGPMAGNPEGLPNVHNCWLNGALDPVPSQVGGLVRALDPQVVVGFGFIAALLLKHAAPDRRTVFVTGTCRQAQDYVTTGRAKDAMHLARALADTGRPPRLVNPEERQAVEACDLVLTHSPLVSEFVSRFFPAFAGKVYPNVIWFAEWICDAARPWCDHARQFEDRDIDVLFVASSWERREKNYPMVAAIANGLPDAAVHVVGDAPHPLHSVTNHGFLADRGALFELLGRARCVVCPSRIDASPGVLFEASAMGCNVVASRNCGNWQLCHADLLADPMHADRFVECTRRALRRKFDDGMDSILRQGSYADLMQTLEAFGRPFDFRDHA